MVETISSQGRPFPRRSEVVAHDDDTMVVALSDDAPRAGIADLRWRLDELLVDGPSTLVIDVSGVTRLSSAAVAALLWTKRRCHARRVRVVVREPSSGSLDLLRRTGLEEVLEIERGYPDRARAGSLDGTTPGRAR